MLESMAREYGPQGFGFLLVYTREAHLGGRYCLHRSVEQKLANAQAFQERGQVERAILVDDLVGNDTSCTGRLPI